MHRKYCIVKIMYSLRRRSILLASFLCFLTLPGSMEIPGLYVTNEAKRTVSFQRFFFYIFLSEFNVFDLGVEERGSGRFLCTCTPQVPGKYSGGRVCSPKWTKARAETFLRK